MKKTMKKSLQKATAILLSAIMVLSAFAMMPADLFKASAADESLFDDRLELDFNNNWKFYLGEESGAYAKAYDDSTWDTVELPHDFSISQDFFSSGVEAESGNLPGGTGWYRKTFVMSTDARDQAVYLNFDGAYKDTYVYVNGELVGENHYGYNSFSFDITDYLVCNGTTANIVAVKVEHQLPSSRWYSGSGIYRDVTMTIVDPVHVDLYGTYVTTPNLQSSNGTDGTVNAVVTLANTNYDKTVTVTAQILDESGNAVGTAASTEVVAAGKVQTEVTLTPTLENPTLWNSWDLGTPYLYTLRTTVAENGTVIDTYDTEFGYRWFNWDADSGFSLNGNNLKIEGVCMHHDQGALGASQVYDAIYRQVKILQDMGCNSIRTSHGTPSDVFMDVCNELGMLVMDEFFDGWTAYKNSNTNDFGAYFDQAIDASTNGLLNAEDGQLWYEFVLTQSVKRDRNDPANVIWDIGNELTEGATGDTSGYSAIAENMMTIIDELDPTRPICQGNNGPSESVKTAIDGFMDVIGGNYNTSSWISIMTGDSDSRSTKPYVGAETASTNNTRGVYNTLDTNGYMCTAYDTKSVSWGQMAASAWYNTIIYDWNSGEYVWTGFDYIGEPTPWNHTTSNYGAGSPVSSYFGIVDTAGFEKDSYYLYRSWWNEDSTTLHLVPGTWDSSALTLNNGYAYVAVYTNADRIELLGDGNVIATAQSTTTTTDAGHKYQTWTETASDSNVNTTEFYTGDGSNFYPQFQVNQSAYSTISVKAYDADGNDITASAVGTKSVSNVEATKITAEAWSDVTYTADGDSYAYIEYTAVDANGNVDTTYNGTLDVTLSGDEVTIVGVDNGDQTATQKFQQNSVFTGDNTVQVQMFNGKALVALRTTEEVATGVEATATSDVPVDGATIEVVAETGDELVDEFEEVIDQPANLVYEPTIYDEYEVLYDKITAGGTATASNEYVEYTAGNVNGNLSVDEVTSTDINSFSDGWYIITGVADYMSYSEGAMTHTTSGSGFHTDGTTIGTVPEPTTDSWYFEQQSDGTFYIYYEDSTGTKQYLNLSSSNATASTTPQALEVAVSGSGITIGDGNGSYLNYSGGESDVAGVWTAATNLTLYKVTGEVSAVDCPVADGTYVIYNNDTRTDADYSDGILSGTIDSVGIPIVITAPVDGVITTESSNAYTFTLVEGTTDEYYIQNSSGQYLSIGSSGGSIAFSDTATSVNVYARDDGSVFIYNADSSQFLDHWYNGSTQDHYNTWESTTSATDVNRIFVLYRNESGVNVPAEKQGLYNALLEGIQYAPGTYSTSSYKTLFDALEAGYAVFESETATTEEITNATTAITEAVAALEVEYKYIPSTLYKYGYVPDSDTPYNDGGALFNAQTYASMEAIIRADDDLMSQIKTAIGYDTETWADDTEKETALDTAIATYAQIYSLSFTGAPVTGQSDVSEFEKTRWNVWCKTGTQAASESAEEGASVQGLFSALRVDGQPTDHAAYSTLPYGNAIDNSNRTDFNTIDGISVSLTINGTETDVTLPALGDISVHINDMFKKEDVYVDSSDTSLGYAKKYWDLEFPLLATTNEYGINTYTYSSSSNTYVFQAEFDDANNSATAVLTPVDDWSVNLHGKDAGQGFFPFNYQSGTTTYTGENAIYHYAFNYDMDFYIPVSGTYADGEDVVFEFSGDDDVLVYIDDVLVLDNGGLHGARAASINFTDATISYQYAMDVDAEDGLVESTTENDVVYAYDDPNKTTICNGDELAALEKLNEVRTDGDYHTFSFYFIERGSTDSNCEMTFNLQQSSEHVLLYDQTLVLDYGLPVEDYDITADNFLSQEGIDAGTKTKLIGIVDGNTPVADVVEFNDVSNLVDTFAASGNTLTVPNMKYGTCTVEKVEVDTYKDSGIVSYTPNTIRMTGEDYFYLCAEVTDDPTYAEGTIYYQYEKVSFIPATSVYYEDNFGTDIKFTNGSGDAVWETVYTDGADANTFANAKQAADVADNDSANPYGFDPVYAGADSTTDYTQYSGFSAQKVTVSAANNPKNGGTNPTVQFTFTGTGFDVVSVTDNTTGAFYVDIYEGEAVDATKKVGKKMVVDTYYGYSYGQLYADANGEATLTATDNTPLYKSAYNEAVTTNATYYSTNASGETIVVTEPSYLDVSGVGYTDTVTYYDADGNLTTTETEDIAYAYAYAYGWIPSGTDVEGLYQIPVIKKQGLDYGTYTVVITPMYSKMFDNADAGQFDVYIDAIRIYDPAGKDDGINSNILTEYKYDNESYVNYLSIKDMLIGADSLAEDTTTQGIVFIDGIAALNNDLDTLKIAGPNNELYLAQNQAIAFEIWATAVPDEVQLGMKSVQGNPVVEITYNGQENTEEPLTLKTATEMNYIINSLLPADGKLTWSEVVVDGVTYYRTGTVVIQNTSDSILSLTSMKWTFTGVGQYGHYEASATETAAVMSFMASEATVSDAYTMMAAKATVEDNESGENTDSDTGAEIIPGDSEDTNDTNDEYQEELTWIQKIIRAITNFFKKIFGLA